MTLEDRMKVMEHHLDRIATALEYLANRPPSTDAVPWMMPPVAVEQSIESASASASASKVPTGQTTWEWLGVTPPATRTRQKQPKRDRRGAEPGNTRAGQCGRCGRPGRRRLNGLDHCVECRLESDEQVAQSWWKE
tara:strand:+ start:333 stop:740 length:408 start_codon:yes stop_codon:yes gene_type:complete